jgi:hypothetical protein
MNCHIHRQASRGVSTPPEALARLDKARTEGAKLQAIEEEL